MDESDLDTQQPCEVTQKARLSLFQTHWAHIPAEQIKNGEDKMMSTDEEARKTIHFIRDYCRKHGVQNTKSLTIADAFACLGGNTQSFSISFKSVVAYEIDQKRYEGLTENVRAYPGQAEHPTVTVKCQDCRATGGILDTYHDVVFMDPPWVTTTTKKVDSKVFIDARDLATRIAEAKTAKYIFLKLPLEAKFPDEFAALRKDISKHWSVIQARILTRHKRRGQQPSYTIVCAYQKAPSAAHTSSEALNTMSLLLTQLHACQFFHDIY